MDTRAKQTLGLELATIRTRLALSRRQVAERSGLGRNTIQAIEDGAYADDAAWEQRIYALGEALGLERRRVWVMLQDVQYYARLRAWLDEWAGLDPASAAIVCTTIGSVLLDETQRRALTRALIGVRRRGGNGPETGDKAG